MNRVVSCGDESIFSFLEGNLSDAATVALEQHMEQCHRCCERLSVLSAEQPFWDDTKTFLSSVERLPKLEPSLGFMTSEDIDTSSAFHPIIRDIPLLPTDDPNKLGRFGGYEISGVIGRGGMGVVLKGWDVALDRFVAIKVLSPAYSHQSAARLRFAREAKAAAAIVHDNIVAIYGVDSCNGLPYLVMPYIKGESLQRRIDRQAPLAIDEILEISLQIARGLQAAHDQGVIHRDIKPANILLPQSVSRVLITDFGLARAVDDATLTSSGMIAGTPAFMSPEQAGGNAIDTRSDLFSLGSVMYAMTCGHPPFRADSAYGVMRRIIDEPHRKLCHLRSDTPIWLQQIIDQLLEKKPAKRFATAAELAEHLEKCLVFFRQPGQPPPPMLKQRRVDWRILWLAIAGFVFIGGAFAWWLQSQATYPDISVSQNVVPYKDDLDIDNDLEQLETQLHQLEEELDR